MLTLRKSKLLITTLLIMGVTSVQASDQLLLIDAINEYRLSLRSCGDKVFEPLPPLSADGRLHLRPDAPGDLQSQVSRNNYPMRNVQSISLSGPRDAQAALLALSESFCKVLMDPQFVDIGVSRIDRDWRIVLARPLLSSKLETWQVEGQKLLAGVNEARAQHQFCGEQTFAPVAALNWREPLAQAAQGHSLSMANGNYFSHLDEQGRTPGDRAELAGYSGASVAESISAASDSIEQVINGWLASPTNCATLMSADYQDFGGAYASDPQSDAGIYWVALFGRP